MKFNPDLAAIHGYLCSDGYVIRNPPTQKHKYYSIGFRNYNIVLLKDFQKKFKKQFNSTPKITNDGRCRLYSKEIYFKLKKKFGSFYSSEWKMPELSKKNLKFWLRSFFDCEAWVELELYKNRRVALESINLEGLKQIKKVLENIFNIKSKIDVKKNGKIYRLSIFGKENLEKFYKNIGFLHPKKT